MTAALAPVPVARWGKDHWSTLAYVAACVEKHHGYLRVEKMRVHPRVHHRLAHPGVAVVMMAFGGVPPTHLADGTTLELHDDWSCVEDMVTAGLVTESEGDNALAGKSPRFDLTDAGRALVVAVAGHRARGGTFATFAPPPDLVAAAPGGDAP